MASQRSTPPNNGPFNGHIRVPYWLFALIVLTAAGLRVLPLFVDGVPSCP